MRGEYVQIILQKRNAKTIAIPWLSSAINISIVIMVIMHKRKHKVSEWLNVSFFFFILFYFISIFYCCKLSQLMNSL